ncbi:hypothetical protein D3C84_978870 [compost metagenome]
MGSRAPTDQNSIPPALPGRILLCRLRLRRLEYGHRSRGDWHPQHVPHVTAGTSPQRQKIHPAAPQRFILQRSAGFPWIFSQLLRCVQHRNPLGCVFRILDSGHEQCPDFTIHLPHDRLQHPAGGHLELQAEVVLCTPCIYRSWVRDV